MIPRPVVEEIQRWMVEGRHGNLQLNFRAGRIENMNRVESVKVETAPDNNIQVRTIVVSKLT